MKIFEGRIEDFAEPRKIDRQAVKEGYERIKNERVDEAAKELARALSNFITAAVEEDELRSIDSAVCMTMGGILFPEGITYEWQAEFCTEAWNAVKAAAVMEKEEHGAD